MSGLRGLCGICRVDLSGAGGSVLGRVDLSGFEWGVWICLGRVDLSGFFEWIGWGGWICRGFLSGISVRFLIILNLDFG